MRHISGRLVEADGRTQLEFRRQDDPQLEATRAAGFAVTRAAIQSVLMTSTTPPDFRHPPSDCDVSDRPALEAFREKHLEWTTLLEHDTQHSVCGQLASLLWQDAVFGLFNEMLRLQDPAKPSAVAAPVFAEAQTEGY